MCGICGCENEEGHHSHAHAHSHAHLHTQEQQRHRRRIEVEKDILTKNAERAAHNRAFFAKEGITAVNVLSAPGSGKTSLLVRLLDMLKGRCPLAVLEGDQYTDLDAQRIRQTGVATLQMNTGRGCHLDALQVAYALTVLPVPTRGFLFIENVGNLVCPGAFDLGETLRLVVLSLTEGEDKPLKYADTFSTAQAVALTKADLAPHLDMPLEALKANLRSACPKAPLFWVSSKTGEGMEALLEWLWAFKTTPPAATHSHG